MDNRRREFSDLLDLSFGLSPGAHFLDDFPVWDLGLAAPGVRVFEHRDSRGLIAACGIREVDLKLGSSDGHLPHLSRVALIGAVCCHPEWRGRGLASRLISEAVQWAKDQGVAAVFLWGSEPGLYQRQGFEWCGRQVRAPLGQVLKNMKTEIDSSERGRVHRGLTSEVFELVCVRDRGLAMGPADWSWYSEHRNVQWYYSKRAGKATAYAAIGRGIDLVGHVHEWGGDLADLSGILEAIHRDHPQAVWLGPPDRYPSVGPSNGEEFLCMAKVLSSSQLPGDLWFWGLDAS